MIYLWIKAFHLAAVMTWIGGMLVLALFLASLSASSPTWSPQEHRAIAAVRQWDGRITTPAMLLAWILGLVMVFQADWFASPWLWVKLVLVVVLAGLHGVQSGTLRRIAGDAGRKPPAFLRFAAPFTLVSVLAIVVLAVTKPF